MLLLSLLFYVLQLCFYLEISLPDLSHQKMMEIYMLHLNYRLHLHNSIRYSYVEVDASYSSTPGIGHYAALSGLNVQTNATNSNCGTIYCQLKPWDQRSKLANRYPV